jgi:hypothetical protein
MNNVLLLNVPTRKMLKNNNLIYKYLQVRECSIIAERSLLCNDVHERNKRRLSQVRNLNNSLIS